MSEQFPLSGKLDFTRTDIPPDINVFSQDFRNGTEVYNNTFESVDFEEIFKNKKYLGDKRRAINEHEKQMYLRKMQLETQQAKEQLMKSQIKKREYFRETNPTPITMSKSSPTNDLKSKTMQSPPRRQIMSRFMQKLIRRSADRDGR